LPLERTLKGHAQKTPGKEFTVRDHYTPPYDVDTQYSDHHELEQQEAMLNSLFDGGVIDSIQLERERRRSGLSTYYIRRKYGKGKEEEKNLELLKEFVQREDIKHRKGELKIWQGASLLECKRPQSWTNLEQIRGGKRGKVKAFSDASRRRMLRLIAKLEQTRKPLWMDLTYPDEFFNERMDGKLLKESHLKKFFQRLQYVYPEVAVIWKLEYKARKSGKHVGAMFPHFHMLVWGLHDENLYDLRQLVARMWWEVCGKLSAKHLEAGTSVSRIKSYRGVFWYASKYMSKEVEEEVSEVGRWWGVKGREKLPEAYCHVIDNLEDEQYKAVIDWMAEYAGFPESEHWKGLTIFCDTDLFMEFQLDKLLEAKEKTPKKFRGYRIYAAQSRRAEVDIATGQELNSYELTPFELKQEIEMWNAETEREKGYNEEEKMLWIVS